MSTFRHRESIDQYSTLEGRKEQWQQGSYVTTKAVNPWPICRRRYCDDYVNSPPYNVSTALNSRRLRVVGTHISGEYVYFPLYDAKYVYHTYSSNRFLSTTYCPLQATPPWDVLETKAFASLSPTAPLVSLPAMLWEMREFPRLLKGLGEILRGGASPQSVLGGYLAYQFGWAPLVSDLTTLVYFAEEVGKRNKFLSGLKDGKRVKRTLYNQTIVSDLGTIPLEYVNLLRITTRKQRGWFTAKVQPAQNFPDIDSLMLADTWSALGLRSGAAIWDAIPWSWLIDYFVNVGDFLEATSGVFPWKLSRMSLMFHEVATERLSVLTCPPGIQVREGYFETESKHRKPVPFPFPKVALMPGLNFWRWLNLGALALAGPLRGIARTG